MAELVEFQCSKDGWQKAIEKPDGFAVCPACNGIVALGAYIEVTDTGQIYKELKKRTFDILKEKHKELWERNRYSVTLPDDSYGEIEVAPFQGSGRMANEEYDKYVQLVREIYSNQKINYLK